MTPFPSDPNSLKLWQALATCLMSSRCSSILMSLICFWKIQVEKSYYEEFEAMNASSDIFTGFALSAPEDTDGQLKFKFVSPCNKKVSHWHFSICNTWQTWPDHWHLLNLFKIRCLLWKKWVLHMCDNTIPLIQGTAGSWWEDYKIGGPMQDLGLQCKI